MEAAFQVHGWHVLDSTVSLHAAFHDSRFRPRSTVPSSLRAASKQNTRDVRKALSYDHGLIAESKFVSRNFLSESYN